MEEVLHTLSTDDIRYLLEQNDGVEVKCDYCSTAYNFSREFLQSLAARKELH
jgi:redox-regulated HSP33 family molecular chaperone